MVYELPDFSEIMGYVNESLMIPFPAVYEFYHMHKNIGTFLQKIGIVLYAQVWQRET